MDARWGESIFLGYARDAQEFAVWDIEKEIVVLARSIKRLPADMRLDGEAIEKVTRWPQDT